MARIAGLSKQIADMALLLMKEGTPLDVALNSASRLSDATPEQVAFADDLLKRRAKAIENAGPGKSTKGIVGPAGNVGWMSIRDGLSYNPNATFERKLQRVNMALDPNPNVNRLTRTADTYVQGRGTALQAAEGRLRAELAMAAAEGNVEKMQLILQDLGFLPDNAYNLAVRTIGQ